MKYAVYLVLGLSVCGCSKAAPAPPAPAATAPVAGAAAAPAAANAAAAAVTPAASASAGAAAPDGAKTYAVFGVKSDDVLNVRAEPTPASKKVYSYAPSVKSIRATGHAIEKDKTPWIEVAFDGGSGWINRLFVTEVHPNGGCEDPNLTAAIRAFMRAVDSSDGAALQAVVSPLRGLLVRQAQENPTVTFAPAQVASLFSATAPSQWGTADGSGAPIVGPFKTLLSPSLHKVVGKGSQEACGKLLMGGSAATNGWPAEYSNLTHVSFHKPAADGANDWVTWVAGLEYVDGKPYVATLVQYQWEI